MKRMFHSKETRIFILWYLCISIFSGIILTGIFIRIFYNERESYNQLLERETQVMMSHFSQSFRIGVNSGNSIFTSTWYLHYVNNANLYYEDFNPIKKKEIINELLAKVNALTYITNILIISPPPLESVISRHGWFNYNEYQQIYGQVNIFYPENDYTIVPLVTPAVDSIVVVQLHDINSRILKSTVCILIDKYSVAQSIRQMMPEYAEYINIDFNGQTLYEYGEHDSKLTSLSKSSYYPPFTMTIAYKRYEDTLMKAALFNYLLLVLIILLSSWVLSLFLTKIMFKPIGRIVNRLGGNYKKLDDPYFFISSSMENMASESMRLSKENEDLAMQLKQFQLQLRDELLFNMMTSSKIRHTSEYVSTVIPWINDGHPYFMVLMESNIKNKVIFENSGILNNTLYYCSFSVPVNEMNILLWYTDNERASLALNEAKKTLDALSAKHGLSVRVSDLIDSPNQMRDMYLRLKTNVVIQGNETTDLSVNQNIDLSAALQSGKYERCLHVLKNIKTDKKVIAALAFLSAASASYNINLDDANKNNKNEDWKQCLLIAEEICRVVSGTRQTGLNKSAEVIAKFINENYNDSGLGMKQLSVQFSMHRTLISKMLKAHLGVTFIDYLANLRLKKAVELMGRRELSMTAIAEEVGYINYITFKRTFIRLYGVSPREYQKNMK